MRPRWLALTILAVQAGASLAAEGVPAAREKIERGRYLTRIMSCNDCHTPWKLGPRGPEPDMTREFSGHPESLRMPAPPALGDGPWQWAGAGTNTAFAGPWGTSFAANLTPDRETGTGAWTEKTFVETLRTGRHLGKGRPLLPPMPWPWVGQATDEDLSAIFAYLRSLTPIRNKVPAPVEPAEPAESAGAGGGR
jgi:hypothetical protein